MNEQPTSRSFTDAVETTATGMRMSSGNNQKHAEKPIDLSKVKRPRDPRLDFFRGIAMFIILIAHTSWNSWTLWIPARFGFSDATEIFVFCSGMASAIAFAAVFDRHNWFMGTARVLHRVWQVYWAHIGMFIVICVWVSWIDVMGNHGNFMKDRLNLMPFFEMNTSQQLLGLLSLTYVPNYFDIMPMYMIILLMIPLVMALSRISPYVAMGFCVLLWLGANVEAWNNWYHNDTSNWLRFSAEPWNSESWMSWYFSGQIPEDVKARLNPRWWFFNPFSWQLIFFTGFAFMRGWLPKPPVNKILIGIAIVVVIASVPLAYYRIYEGALWGDDINAWLKSSPLLEWRESIRSLIWKTDFGLFRYLHFLAVGYLAWVAVGEGGKRLISDGLWGKFVAVVKTVGQQSLAIFLFSMVFAQMIGYTFYPPVDHPFHITAPDSNWRWLHSTIVNIGGMITLVLVAYMVAWFKKQPWRNPPKVKVV